MVGRRAWRRGFRPSPEALEGCAKKSGLILMALDEEGEGEGGGSLIELAI